MSGIITPNHCGVNIPPWNYSTECFYGRSKKLIDDRLKKLIDLKGYAPTRLANETGMPLERWKGFIYGRIRAGGDHIEAIAELWPEYRYWIISGEAAPEIGQISPEIEETRSNSKKAPKATG